MSPGFFTMHDDTQVARVIVMGKALRNGQFPVRWVSDLGYGYGYPLFNFYGPLPYYIGGFFYLLGFSGLTATKLMFFIGMVLPTVTMFFLVNDALGKITAVIASILLLYAPYHAVQLYVRGAVGEFWALGFYPLVLYGLLSRPVLKRRSLIGGIGLFGVIVSHTISAYTTLFLVSSGLLLSWFCMILLRKFDWHLVKQHLLLVVIGLGLSAFFWLPSLGEMRFSNVRSQIGGGADFHDHFVCLDQLWDSAWGYGGSIPGCVDGLSFKLGKLHIVLATATVVAFAVVRMKKFQRQTSILLISLAIVLVSVFFTNSVSTAVWERLPFIAYVQYPWRFLSYVIFGLSLLASGSIFWIKNKFFQLVAAIPLLIGIVWYNGKLFSPQFMYNKPASDFESIDELRFRVSKISDEYLPIEVPRPTTKEHSIHDTIPVTSGLQVDTEVDTETYAKFIFHSNDGNTVHIQRAFFPGWQYWFDGKIVHPKLEHGLPVWYAPSGNHVFEMYFTNTPIRFIGNLVSILTGVILLFTYGNKKIIT